MLFKEYTESLAALEQLSSRNEMMEQLADLINQLQVSGEIESGLYLLKARISPEYSDLELNFSNKSFLNAISEMVSSLGLKYDANARYKELGDSGLVAEEFLQGYQNGNIEQELQQDLLMEANTLEIIPKDFQVKDIFTALKQVAIQEGSGSVAEKSKIVIDVLTKLTPLEARFFGRMSTGKLRLGLSNKTILDALSWAKTGDKSLRKDLDRAYGVRSDIAKIADLLFSESENITDLTLELGVPVSAQLVEREKDAEKIIERMGEAIIQAKYDGLRAQLHYSKTEFSNDHSQDKHVSIFSRNMESLTAMFPDLVEIFKDKAKVESIVFDGEAIGYDESTDTFLPFQQTIQRKRKYGVAEKVEEVPIRYFVFDILYLNGKDLTQIPLSDRLDLLRGLDISSWDSRLVMTDSPLVSDAKELDNHFRELISIGLEGIIAKDPASIYQPGKRGYDWIKLKANTHSDLKDTVDCVVMGYYKGRGHRARFGIGGFLVGIYNENTNSYQSIAKVGSGVKESEWADIKAQLDEISESDLPDNYEIAKELVPDVIVSPEIVMEVDADEISLSEIHKAGIGAGIEVLDAGGVAFSLRFPRMKVFSRVDKDPQDTTKPSEIASLYGFSK